MTEFNYLVEKKRMLDSIGRTEGTCTGCSCDDCLFNMRNNRLAVSCSSFEMNHPEEATQIIKKWSEEHPHITNADKFEEVFGLNLTSSHDNEGYFYFYGLAINTSEEAKQWLNSEYKET